MNAHIHFHIDHNHDRLLDRISRELTVAYDWLTGPAMSDQERLNRELAQTRSNKYSNGVI